MIQNQKTDADGPGADIFSQAETRAMERALTLAARGMGRTSPNPMVGAVVLSPGGQTLGEGWHPAPGQPHAEVLALRDAEARGHGSQLRGCTVVVTLEPCCHQGRTGPCTRTLIAARVGRVVLATLDPNPHVAGRGMAELAEAGIAVAVGLLADQAEDLNAGFFTAHRLGRPLVTLKWAMTLDGRLATDQGHSRWITGPDARRHVHQWRARHDAVLVASGTVLADDPALTVRLDPDAWPVPGVMPVQPRVVVVEGRRRIPSQARCLNPEEGIVPGREPILARAMDSGPSHDEPEAGFPAHVQTLSLPSPKTPDAVDLAAFLRKLFVDHGVLTVYCEGGGTLQGHLMDGGLVDRVHAYVAPQLVGGQGRYLPLQGQGVAQMSEALVLERVETLALGPDICMIGWIAGQRRRSLRG